jgi:lipopolysaccharide assembly outer membrane protein LptD (OstA)
MPNSFVGNDRVSDARRLTAALTTRFIDPSSGDERARFVFAEQYDFRTPQVTLNVGDPIGTVARTGVIAGASYKLGPGFSARVCRVIPRRPRKANRHRDLAIIRNRRWLGGSAARLH